MSIKRTSGLSSCAIRHRRTNTYASAIWSRQDRLPHPASATKARAKASRVSGVHWPAGKGLGGSLANARFPGNAKLARVIAQARAKPT